MDLIAPASWGAHTALALAPHPDDTETIAVTLDLLRHHGWELHWAIVTSGWSGVQDSFVGPAHAAKAAARRAEQRDAARGFGLPEDRLTFLDLPEDSQGELADLEISRQTLHAWLDQLQPDLTLLPWREDTNATHRRVYDWFARWATGAGKPVVALGNEDPKTQGFVCHARVVFDEAKARWKAALLECHRSQSVRNQSTRGHNFAERILRQNQAVPGLASGQYAERFHAGFWQNTPNRA